MITRNTTIPAEALRAPTIFGWILQPTFPMDAKTRTSVDPFSADFSAQRDLADTTDRETFRATPFIEFQSNNELLGRHRLTGLYSSQEITTLSTNHQFGQTFSGPESDVPVIFGNLSRPGHFVFRMPTLVYLQRCPVRRLYVRFHHPPKV